MTNPIIATISPSYFSVIREFVPKLSSQSNKP